MPWTGDVAAGAGFTAPGVEPWLPFGDVAACNVDAQRDDPDSVLSFTRSAAGAPPRARRPADRRVHRSRRRRRCVGVAARRRPCWSRSTSPAQPATVTLDGVRATVRLGTRPGRDGEALDGTVTLAPWEAVVVTLTASAVTRRPARSVGEQEHGVVGRDAAELLVGELAADAVEEDADLGLPPLQVRAQDRRPFRRRRSRSRGTARSGGRLAAHPIRRRAGCAPTG